MEPSSDPLTQPYTAPSYWSVQCWYYAHCSQKKNPTSTTGTHRVLGAFSGASGFPRFIWGNKSPMHAPLGQFFSPRGRSMWTQAPKKKSKRGKSAASSPGLYRIVQHNPPTTSDLEVTLSAGHFGFGGKGREGKREEGRFTPSLKKTSKKLTDHKPVHTK